MDSLSSFFVGFGILVIVGREPLVFAPSATLRFYDRLLFSTDARVRALCAVIATLTMALLVSDFGEGLQAVGQLPPDPPVVTRAPDVGAMATSAAAQSRAEGYIEEEFFVSGAAQAYVRQGTWGADGVWTATPAEAAPYRIRMLVRYPADPGRFNGVVVVEWLNVSGQTEADPDFSSLHVELFREGYAYVGVGAQRAGIDGQRGLRTQNAARYASLAHPGDSYSYDIFAQAGQAVRAPTGIAPLGALTDRVHHLVADGESQSAGRMVTYVNAVHPLAQVYDAFFIHSRSGGAAPLAQGPSPARIRTDLRVPVFQVQAETDVPRFVGARQPDTDHLRTWELAGTAHADRYILTWRRHPTDGADLHRSGRGSGRADQRRANDLLDAGGAPAPAALGG